MTIKTRCGVLQLDRQYEELDALLFLNKTSFPLQNDENLPFTAKTAVRDLSPLNSFLLNSLNSSWYIQQGAGNVHLRLWSTLAGYHHTVTVDLMAAHPWCEFSIPLLYTQPVHMAAPVYSYSVLCIQWCSLAFFGFNDWWFELLLLLSQSRLANLIFT